MTYTITQSYQITVGLNNCPFKKWDIIRHSANNEAIVIRVSGKWPGQTSATLYPYKRHNKKWKHWIWFKWLKLRVWIGDFYKK